MDTPVVHLCSVPFTSSASLGIPMGSIVSFWSLTNITRLDLEPGIGSSPLTDSSSIIQPGRGDLLPEHEHSKGADTPASSHLVDRHLAAVIPLPLLDTSYQLFFCSVCWGYSQSPGAG